jgi:broad specificity phosphatase PhoE
MPSIRLALIRHSKSCSNLVRDSAKTHKGDIDWAHPIAKISQQIRDPGLTAVGRRMASVYSPTLQTRLTAAGLNIDRAIVGSSALRRAKETAALLFPEHSRIVFPHLTEHGALPENTPRGAHKSRPDWRAFIEHLCDTIVGDCDIIIVGHGSYLKSVWADITGVTASLHNLDGFIVDGTIDSGRLHVSKTTKIPYDHGVNMEIADKCATSEDHHFVARKLAAHTKKMARRSTTSKRRSYKHNGSRRQRGGAGMPLAWYQPGAQMRAPYIAEATGTAAAASTAGWARTGLAQTGGRRLTRRQKQQGGFAPSVMGSFVSNGTRLLPVASYMGYKLFSGKKGRRTHRRR